LVLIVSDGPDNIQEYMQVFCLAEGASLGLLPMQAQTCLLVNKAAVITCRLLRRFRGGMMKKKMRWQQGIL